MTILDSMLRSRDSTLPTKVCIVKAIVVPLIMYRCESWTLKKLESRRIDAFELWSGEDSWESLEQARRSNQSILKEISTEYSLEGLMLKLQSTDAKSQLIRKDHDAGKDWGQEEKRAAEDEMDGIACSMKMNLSKLQDTVGFPGGSTGKESACNTEDLGSIPGLGRSPGEGKGYPLQYSGLENSMDCIVHGVTKSRTQQSNFHFPGHREGRGSLACHSSWSHRVGHN